MQSVTPKYAILPFSGHGFTWRTFEAFFLDFLSAGPELISPDRKTKKVVSAERYGRPGDDQKGIDIRATLTDGTVWVFQCKHYTSTNFCPEKARTAVAKCSVSAERKFLLITRDVSEDCKAAVRSKPDWEIWDAGEITQQFLHRLPDKLEAARILYRHFGPGWAEQFFDLPGHVPLMGAEARFQSQLRDDQTFHHSLALVGRKKWLGELTSFTAAKRRRVFLLQGRGGIGKSRLLLEWARSEAVNVRFLSDAPAHAADYGRAIDHSPKPLILVLDDAHRLDEIRRSLFPVVAERPDLKLVLSFRPGPNAQVRSELIEAGFDTGQIVAPEPLQPLSAAATLKMINAALGSEFATQHRQWVATISRECPLLAVLAAQLIRSGDLREQDFEDTEAFKDHVLRKGFERDLVRVSKELKINLPVARQIAQLIALLGPIPIDNGFSKKAAKFVASNISPHLVQEVIDGFREVGLLHETEAGARVVPDLLSDHLVYTACYDGAAQDRAFVAGVIEQFQSDSLRRMLQHLAEAEWRATRTSRHADSVIEPLWQWYIARYHSTPFHEKSDLLSQWTNIAHLQPRRSLELAAIALESGHQSEVIDLTGDIVDLLKPVAGSWPDHVAACLDLLWAIGSNIDESDTQWTHRKHPITVIGEIAGFEVWKLWTVSEAVLDWMEQRFTNTDSINTKSPPWQVVTDLFRPMFTTEMEDNWSSGVTVHFRSHLVPLPQTSSIRARARALLRRIAEWRNTALTLGVIEVMRSALDCARLRFANNPPAAYVNRWDEERLKTLSTLEDIIRTHSTPIILFQARTILLRHSRRNPNEFQSRCNAVLDSIPDSLELRLIRATLGHDHEEFCEKLENEDSAAWHDRIEQQWNTFIESIAKELMKATANPVRFLDQIEELNTVLTSFDYTPAWRPIFSRLSKSEPAFARAAAIELIRKKPASLTEELDALAYAASKQSPRTRLDLCQSAIATTDPGLTAGAIQLLTWWRKDERQLPEEGWSLLLIAAPNPSPPAIHAILNFGWANHQWLEARDWELLAALPDIDSPSLADQFLRRVVLLNERCAGKLNRECLTKILAKMEGVAKVPNADSENHLAKLAKTFPETIFLFIWKRIQRRKHEKRPAFQPLPLEFEEISFTNLVHDPEVAAIVDVMESRILNGETLDPDENQLLAGLALHESAGNSQRFINLVERVSNPIQLASVRKMISSPLNRSAALIAPTLVKALLQKARAFGDSVYRETSTQLILLRGARGGSNDGPDREWKQLLANVESLAHRHAHDPDLGPLYATAAREERAWMERMRQTNPPFCEDPE